MFSPDVIIVFQVSAIPAASSTVTSPTVVDTDYKKFDCSFSIDLPAVTGAYRYDVNFFPGDVTATAGNTINIGKFTCKQTFVPEANVSIIRSIVKFSTLGLLIVIILFEDVSL